MTPNAKGVSAGHDIMSVRDLEASNKFWIALGGEPATFGVLKLIKFPGVLFYMRQAENKGGTEGSAVEYIGFKVRNLKESIERWKTAGIQPLPGASGKQAFLMAPDDIKVRVVEDKKLTVPIAADALHLNVADPKAAQEWYEKWFGTKIPGSNLEFEAKAAQPTKGRAFDRIGLEVHDLEPFCKKLEDAGIKLDTGYRKATNMKLAICVLTDPWGTLIELSDGLAAVE